MPSPRPPRSRFGLLSPAVPRYARGRRLGQLFAGLLLYGFSLAVMIRAGLGLDPWDVLHQGLADRLPLSFGGTVTVVSVLVLLLWIPLRQRPGFGTLANAAVIGLATDLSLFVLPAPPSTVVAAIAMVAAVPLNALAGALYLGAGLGPGPRDGLMTGLVARGVGSVAVVRTALEGTVLLVGWLLGGTVGAGTVLYAIGIGPLLHVLLPRFVIPLADPARAAAG